MRWPERRLLLAVPAILLAGCGGCGSTSAGDPVSPVQSAAKRGVRLVRVGRFSSPVYVTGVGSRLYVVEQGGRIVVLHDGRRRTFLDIRSLVTAGGEQGLLSIAFPPDHASTKAFYVYYTDRDQQQRIVAYRMASADRAQPGSAHLVMRMADHESNHNGGLLLFGPDRHMYVGTGDGGGGGDQHGAHGNAQNLASPLGKILRIDPHPGGGYSVPAGNLRGPIYAYGLRNPWRFSFDRSTADLLIGDVGQNAVEEIDFVKRGGGRGANFGWRVFEGRSRYTKGEQAPGAVAPVFTASHADGWCSITGGVVVRDRALAGLYGQYVFGDFCKGELLAGRPARPRMKVHDTGLKVPNLSSFGEDARGRVYAVSLNGAVYRLAAR